MKKLSHQDGGFSDELVRRDFEVEGCGALADASCRVVVRPGARMHKFAGNRRGQKKWRVFGGGGGQGRRRGERDGGRGRKREHGIRREMFRKT